MRKLRTCSGEAVPMLELSFSKKSCLRGTNRNVRTPEAIAAMMTQLFGCKSFEEFYAVYLNAQNGVVGVSLIGRGGLAEVSVDPRVIFAGALSVGAVAVILVHNHPSGSLQPSVQDVQLTERVVAAGKILSIGVLDHLIISRTGGFYSFATEGKMPS